MYAIQRWFGLSYSIITNDYDILKFQISTANISSPSSNRFRLHMWNRIHCHNVNCIYCLNRHICKRHQMSDDHMMGLNTFSIRMSQTPVIHMMSHIRDHNSHHDSRNCVMHDLRSNYNSVSFECYQLGNNIKCKNVIIPWL